MKVRPILAALNDTYRLNSKKVVELVEEADSNRSLEEVDLDAFTEYLHSLKIGNDDLEPIVNKILSTLNEADLKEYEEYIGYIEEQDRRFITVLDEEYPDRLKQIEKPPLALYIDGNLEYYKEGVALVGTRSANDFRLESAHKIGKTLVEHDYTVISGLANGIDEAGHRSAISFGGKTVAVLPGDLDNVYPEENRQIAENVPLNGVLVSEVSENVPLNRHRFVERNRITSGLSKAVIIGASKETGGTVRQAEFADTHDIPILLYDPEREDGQSPDVIKEMGAHTFEDLNDLEVLLENIDELRKPNGGNMCLDDYQ